MSAPVPWYYEYFQACEPLHCPPWELIDDYTPREFWVDAALIVRGAELDHMRHVQQRNEAKAAQQKKAR